MRGDVDFGVHLPQIGWSGPPPGPADLLRYVAEAQALGFTAVSVNDHLVWSRPWLDGTVALAAIIPAAEGMTPATTIGLPVIRGPIAFAKTLTALDLLSGGRAIAGVGPGSSQRDYEVAGIDWSERWPRFEEAILAIRALWGRDEGPFEGKYYSTAGVQLEPRPAQPAGPPIWIGSWGSEVGLRRVARLGDGWLASAYNATPETFAERLGSLGEALVSCGRDPAGFPNALATMFLHVTEDEREARRVIEDLVAPAVRRPPDELSTRLLIGPAEVCAERVDRYRAAGAGRIHLWPVTDELAQLEAFVGRVLTLLA
jgi:alkanesulfonate monooxygenase SsuD/methylene tetrahydromethanopterin reductase-like flavin-dependent oxidoreductase (luciferase family)